MTTYFDFAGVSFDPVNPLSVFLADLPEGQRTKAMQKWVVLAVPVIIEKGPEAYLTAVIQAVEKRTGARFPPLRKDRTRRTVLETWANERKAADAAREIAFYLYDNVARNYWNVIAPNRLRRR